MKRNLLVLLLVAVCVPAYAAITPNEYSDPGYMINAGWSEATAEEVNLEKNRKSGNPVEPLYQSKRYSNKFVRALWNAYGYIDPSVDTEERLHHDIHQSPHWRDL